MNKNTLKLILIVPMIFLIVAPLYKFPYGLYILLRLIVFASSACMIYFSFKDTKELNVTVLIFGFIALLFNPFLVDRMRPLKPNEGFLFYKNGRR